MRTPKKKILKIRNHLKRKKIWLSKSRGFSFPYNLWGGGCESSSPVTGRVSFDRMEIFFLDNLTWTRTGWIPDKLSAMFPSTSGWRLFQNKNWDGDCSTQNWYLSGLSKEICLSIQQQRQASVLSLTPFHPSVLMSWPAVVWWRELFGQRSWSP